MISGLIIYSRIDKDKNAWFINRCIENLTKKGISLVYKYENDKLKEVTIVNTEFFNE